MREDWKYLPLGEICEFISGFTPKKDELNKEEGAPYYKVSDMNRNANSLYMEETELFVAHPRKTIPANSIIFPKNGGAIFTGKKRILKYDSIIDLNTEAINIKDKNIDILFLYSFLLGIDFGQFDNGGGLPSINIRKMKEFIVPIPPLPEQERIVALLDDQFAKIDALKANADQQLKAAKDLFQSALKEMLTPKEGWDEKELGKICKKVQNIKWSNESGIKRYIDLTSVSRESLSIIDSVEIDYTNAPSRAKQIIKEGDILFATTRPTLRRVCRVSEDFNDQICSTGFCVLRSASEIDFNFLFYNLLTDSFYSYIEPLQTGASYPAVTDSLVKAYPISFPSLPEQERIATRLDAISEKVKALQANYDQTITLCNDLKQSLLKSIFA